MVDDDGKEEAVVIDIKVLKKTIVIAILEAQLIVLPDSQRSILLYCIKYI